MFFPGSVLGAGETATREYALYIGPKKLSLLQQLGNGMDAVRDFLARESGRIELRFRSQADAGQPFRAADFVIRLPASAAVAG